MRCLLTLVLVFLAAADVSAAQVGAGEGPRRLGNWTDPDLGGAIVEGIATRDFLWLRGVSRTVVRFDRRTGERSRVAVDAVDLLADGPHLWALLVLNENESTVRDLRDPTAHQQRVSFLGTPLALFATSGRPGVLTDVNVLVPSGHRWSRRGLAGSLQSGGHVSALTGDALFVGYNLGEWGGGLRRIDVATGTVSFVQEPGETVCSGRLDPECAPIVGIVPDDAGAGCVLVGTSLAHISIRRGEVLRVCDDQVSSVFRDPLPVEPNSIINRPGQSWPFDSLTQTRDGWVAVGQERFARSRQGTVMIEAVPDLRAWAGLRISDPADELIFAEAACCWGSDALVRYRVVAIPIVP
ncbi:MAG: hypothetical protein Q8S03_07930 [Brevundimonas sp.]|uniref:hypothetical protein n=1 Tax=Brevundimonas sp. TaxID=1871086 RepID=UPI002733A020|nr:hypothetical protein [Brevundimonas sp.]MDP3404602.1 hypothetical protein [Brevundimonas sp.]